MLRLLSPLRAAGPEQMALDEALLAEARQATLRLYEWLPACVSLGYFQDYHHIRPQLPASMPVVRRITGGGAIWHQHEVTYALVGRLGEAGLPEQPRQLYPLLHGAVREELAAAGAALDLQVESGGDRRYRAEPRCFASPAVDDLIQPGAGKVLGSAARCRGRRMLLHGSLKLASNPWDGDRVSGCGLDLQAAGACLIAGISRALRLQVVPGDLTAAEIAAAESIRHLRYDNPAWVEERRGPRP